MIQTQPIERLINLIDEDSNFTFGMSSSEASNLVGTGDPEAVRKIDGQFALVHKEGNVVRLARSIGRPMRYFLAKQAAGPTLIVAETIREIYEFLKGEGLDDQFHPSYTRMVPAHHVTELSLLGCPDPAPVYKRFVQSVPNALAPDIQSIGEAYIGTLAEEIDKWIDKIPKNEPIGVMFSGGIDSGAVLVLANHLLLKRGEAAQRLKAFTLSVDNAGSDITQAQAFLSDLGLGHLLEQIDVSASDLKFHEAIKTIEDYKPLDVQAATMTLALLNRVRELYPEWRYLLDGDGGDENLRDYPIEENPELTIRSVLSNSFFYHEGWGVDKIKHSLTYSGGQSRGHVRSHAPARSLGFHGFSPFATPKVIEVAEQIPFVELTDWDHEKLYSLKGEVTRAGIKAITGDSIPVFEKNRFQRGAVAPDVFENVFPETEQEYRDTFSGVFSY
ncbi:MAG: asparagine synthetase B family protein [Pyrinomonadaceae bacterium]|nr:asparagine synthetase B family protein [Pyrinomonadaceae bacterium]